MLRALIIFFYFWKNVIFRIFWRKNRVKQPLLLARDFRYIVRYYPWQLPTYMASLFMSLAINLSLVSLSPAVIVHRCRWHRWKIYRRYQRHRRSLKIRDTSDIFIAGVVDTGEQLNDTGDKHSFTNFQKNSKRSQLGARGTMVHEKTFSQKSRVRLLKAILSFPIVICKGDQQDDEILDKSWSKCPVCPFSTTKTIFYVWTPVPPPISFYTERGMSGFI